MLSQGYIQPPLYPVFCFLGCQVIPDCNYWSFYPDQLFCQFWVVVDELSPTMIPNLFASKNCNPDTRKPEDTTAAPTTTSTTTTTQDTTTTTQDTTSTTSTSTTSTS